MDEASAPRRNGLMAGVNPWVPSVQKWDGKNEKISDTDGLSV